MPSETPFRIALVIVFLMTVPIGLYYRLQVAASGEKISRKEEGYVFPILLRLAGVCAAISIFTYVLFPDDVQWASVPASNWMRWVAVSVFALGPVLIYWTFSTLGKNLTDTVITRANATLVTHGPYRWVRHPFYVTGALILASVTLLSANWLIGLLGLAVLGLLAIRTLKEEQMLIDRFGQEYRNYMTRTGMFFPKRFC